MKLSHLAAVFSLLVCNVSFADDIEIIGSLSYTFSQPATNKATASETKQISLIQLKLSQKARTAILGRLTQKNEPKKLTGEETSIQLGMNGVPILDEGSHGTSATFANTAVIDAALNKGDYISQLCQLELGQYLEKKAYQPSGWSGSLGRTILNQMMVFGIVNTQNQKNQGCGGLTTYPLYGDNPKTEISVEEFRTMSESLAENGISWSPILDIYQFMIEKINTGHTLESVKNALRAGDRVTFAVLIPDYHLGVVGAVGRHHARNDTWVLTPEIIIDIPHAEGTHEMIITGFDDEAIAKDDQGREYRGLLSLRSSWGTNIGDRGEFYMTYDYFKTLVLEAQRIRRRILESEVN